MDTQKFEIDRVERFWYWSGRNYQTFKEITFWYNPITLERKETSRIWSGDDWNKPEWVQCITEHNKMLDANYF